MRQFWLGLYVLIALFNLLVLAWLFILGSAFAFSGAGLFMFFFFTLLLMIFIALKESAAKGLHGDKDSREFPRVEQSNKSSKSNASG